MVPPGELPVSRRILVDLNRTMTADFALGECKESFERLAGQDLNFKHQVSTGTQGQSLDGKQVSSLQPSDDVKKLSVSRPLADAPLHFERES